MKTAKVFTSTIMSIIVILFLPFSSLAQAGSLDLSFDSDGKVTTSFGTGNDLGKSVALQTDGKILVSGYSNNGSNNDFAVVRYNTNGSLDTTFNADGKVTTSIGTNDDVGNSIAIQLDGKILVAGYSYNGSTTNFAIIRYNLNGSLDTTFDTDGIVTTTIGTNDDKGYSIVIQSDSKILVAGYSFNGSSQDFALVRYNPNGSLDTTFDNDGKLTTSFGAYDDFGSSLILQSDGKILVAGTGGSNINLKVFALARYNTNGSLDSTFDSDGRVTTAIGLYANYGQSVLVQPDGKIIVTGHSNFGFGPILALVRYNSNGSIDTTFDTDGIVTATSVYSMGYAAVLQPDNKILVAGWRDTTSLSSHHTFALTRFSTNGSLDPTFGTYGIASVSIGIDNASYSIAFQTDSKILIVGHSYDSNYNFDFALARFHNDTCPSVSFAQSLTICSGQSISVGSNTYNSSGAYTDTLISLLTGCDSIVATNLTVSPIPILTISFDGIQIYSNQNLAGYQWIDCGNGNFPLAGETNQTFTPTMNGNFGVIVTLGLCTDTSDCLNIISLKDNEILNLFTEISIYPNPFSSSTILQSNYLLDNAIVNVYNIYGQQVKQMSNLYGNIIPLNLDNLPRGLYFIRLNQEDKLILSNKIVIKD